MGRRPSLWSERKIAARIRAGYGSGELSSYRPWFTVRDVSSRGITTRFASLELDRTMLFLSNIELWAFLAKAREDGFLDYCEQLYLPRDETQEIARSLGVRHSRYFGTKRPLVMTLDGLATYARDGRVIRQAIDCKPYFRLGDPRTEEKLAINRTYAERRGWEYLRFTEYSVSPIAIANIQWMRRSFEWEGDKVESFGKFEHWAMRLYAQMKRDQGTPTWDCSVNEYLKRFDSAQSLPPGAAMRCLPILMLNKLVLPQSLEISHLRMLDSPIEQLRLRDLPTSGDLSAQWRAVA